jgi:Tfp pilus assembly protein PilF
MLRSLLAQIFTGSRPAAKPPQPRDDFAQVREHIAAKEWDAADAALAPLLEANAERVDAWVLKGEALRKRGAYAEAKDAYRRALVLDSRRADAWLDLGVCHYQLGDHFWARIYFRFAAALERDNADIWNEFGLVEITLGNFEKAEESLETAVNRNPQHAEAWNNLGLVLARRGDLANARRYFLRASFLKPGFYMAFCNLGLVCRDLELLAEAEQALRRALEIDPCALSARLNLAMVLQDAGRLEEAAAILEAAHADYPDDAEIGAARSALALRRGDSVAAERLAGEILKAAPEHADARLALAHAQLAQARFAEGWQNYEARLRSSTSPARHFAFPPWQGQPLAGKSVLVYGEQGLGDEIMFASWLPELLAAGAVCLLDCNRRLRSLFRASFAQVEIVESVAALESEVAAGARKLDFCLPMGSLPRALGHGSRVAGARRAYLHADEARASYWRGQLETLGPGRKIGLCWRGGLYKTGRELRSLSLEALLPVLQTPGIRWVNLMHNDYRDEIERLSRAQGVEIAIWQEALAALEETAALVSGLDLVISVCSSVVHLGGALGREVWVLTPSAPAWRYLQNGSQMPWYASVRLFRQREASAWGPVVTEIARELRASA